MAKRLTIPSHQLKRFRRAMRGAVLRFNGNESGVQQCTDGQGCLMTPDQLDGILVTSWCWRIWCKVTAQAIGFERCEEIEFDISTPTRLNDLGDYVNDWKTAALLDMPEGYDFKKLEWTARILR